MRTYFQLRAGGLDEVKGEVVREQPLIVYIDGERFNLYAEEAIALPGAA